MDKITLGNILSGFSLTKINDNFDKIEDVINNGLLGKQGDTLQGDLDLNGKHLYNLPAPSEDSHPARLKDVKNAIAGLAAQTANLISFEPTSAITSNNIQGAVEQVGTYISSFPGSVARLAKDRDSVVYAEDFNTLRQAVVAAAGKTLVLNGAYTVDNSTQDGLVIDVDNIRITGVGTINATSIVANAVKVTGKNVTIEDITIKGPGAYDTSGAGGAVIPGLLYVDGTDATGPINCHIHNVKVKEPGKMGIVAYKAVGIEITGCTVENSLPVSTWLNTSNNHLIRLYACARYVVRGNFLKGFSEGIVVQSYPDQVFNDYSGTVSNKSRKGIVCDNLVLSTYDHCIYFSNDNEHYICSNNFLWMASYLEGGEGTCSLKLEGGYFAAIGNYCREGIQMRNPYNGRVENNVVLVYSGRGTTHNPSKMAILSQDTIFKRDMASLSINNNNIAVVGDIEVDAGIWVEGSVWDGFQCKILDLSVCGNTITGLGKSLSGNSFGILVHQDMPKDGNGNIIGSTASGVTISNNMINLQAFTGFVPGCGSYGIELLNVDVANVSGNTVKNFYLRGINALGMRYSHVSDNILIGIYGSAAQKLAMFEDGTNLTLHVDSVQNTYGINHVENVDYKYFPAHQSTTCSDKLPILNAGASNFSQTLSSYDMTDLFVWGPTASALTLTLATNRPWGVGQKVSIFNSGNQPFNITNTGTTVSPGNKVTVCCIGGNSFIVYV